MTEIIDLFNGPWRGHCHTSIIEAGSRLKLNCSTCSTVLNGSLELPRGEHLSIEHHAILPLVVEEPMTTETMKRGEPLWRNDHRRVNDIALIRYPLTKDGDGQT